MCNMPEFKRTATLQGNASGINNIEGIAIAGAFFFFALEHSLLISTKGSADVGCHEIYGTLKGRMLA